LASPLLACSFLKDGRAERHSATQRSPRSHSSASLRSRSASALTFAARASLRYRTARALLTASQIPGVGSRSGFGNVYDRLGELVGVPIRAFGCLPVIRLPQSFACQRSLVEVRPAIPVCILVGSVGLCVRAGLCGASDPWRSSAAIQILRGLVVVQTSLVPSREHTLQNVRFRVNNTAIIKLTHYPGVP
jgi:hypothetical protein